MSNIALPRREILNSIISYTEANKNVVLLVCDMGFGVMDNFKSKFPDRVINTGIMEQGTIGIAAGLAMSGMLPIVYSIVNFLVFRGLEQIRNDVVLQKLNVKFIATGVNDYFKFLGKSHCCGQDDITIMKLIGMDVYDPYTPDSGDFFELSKKWITSPNAGYMRV